MRHQRHRAVAQRRLDRNRLGFRLEIRPGGRRGIGRRCSGRVGLGLRLGGDAPCPDDRQGVVDLAAVVGAVEHLDGDRGLPGAGGLDQPLHVGGGKQHLPGHAELAALGLLEGDREALVAALGVAVHRGGRLAVEVGLGAEAEAAPVARLEGGVAQVGGAAAALRALQHRDLPVLQGVALAGIAGEVEHDPAAGILDRAGAGAAGQRQIVDGAMGREMHALGRPGGRREREHDAREGCSHEVSRGPSVIASARFLPRKIGPAPPPGNVSGRGWGRGPWRCGHACRRPHRQPSQVEACDGGSTHARRTDPHGRLDELGRQVIDQKRDLSTDKEFGRGGRAARRGDGARFGQAAGCGEKPARPGAGLLRGC